MLINVLSCLFQDTGRNLKSCFIHTASPNPSKKHILHTKQWIKLSWHMQHIQIILHGITNLMTTYQINGLWNIGLGLHGMQLSSGTQVGVLVQVPSILQVTFLMAQTCPCVQTVCEQDGARFDTQIGVNVSLLPTSTSQCDPSGHSNAQGGSVVPATAVSKPLYNFLTQ
jgi:hypothetical protein